MPEYGFSDKVAFVTGAARGQGVCRHTVLDEACPDRPEDGPVRDSDLRNPSLVHQRHRLSFSR